MEENEEDLDLSLGQIENLLDESQSHHSENMGEGEHQDLSKIREEKVESEHEEPLHSEKEIQCELLQEEKESQEVWEQGCLNRIMTSRQKFLKMKSDALIFKQMSKLPSVSKEFKKHFSKPGLSPLSSPRGMKPKSHKTSKMTNRRLRMMNSRSFDLKLNSSISNSNKISEEDSKFTESVSLANSFKEIFTENQTSQKDMAIGVQKASIGESGENEFERAGDLKEDHSSVSSNQQKAKKLASTLSLQIDLKELIAEENAFKESEETLQYQLPIKLLDAAEKVATKVMGLQRDQYGDLIIDLDEPTPENQELKQAGEMMQYWISKLFKAKNFKDMGSIFAQKVPTETRGLQCELLGSKIMQSSSSIGDEPVHTSKKRVIGLKRSKLAKINVLEANQFSSAPITEIKAFNLSMKTKKTVKEAGTKIPKFLTTFKNLLQNNRQKLVKEYRPVPVKLMIKNIQSCFSEKSQGAKDSKIIRNQTMPEYLYDVTFNKYGIAKLTEKKLKEMCLCIVQNKQKQGMIDLFSRFMGLGDAYFTNDDLSLYYKVNDLIFVNDSTSINAELGIDLMKEYFTDKILAVDLENLLASYHQYSEKLQSSKPNSDFDLPELMICAIKAYKDLKLHLYNFYKKQIKLAMSKATLTSPEQKEHYSDLPSPISPVPVEGDSDPLIVLGVFMTKEQFFKVLEEIDKVNHLELREGEKEEEKGPEVASSATVKAPVFRSRLGSVNDTRKYIEGKYLIEGHVQVENLISLLIHKQVYYYNNQEAEAKEKQ